jgi:hypothetical protein
MSRELPRDGRPIRYGQFWKKCAYRDTCQTCQESKGHGPYWYAIWKEAGRSVRKYCGKRDPRPAPTEGNEAMQHAERKETQQQAAEPIAELLVTRLLPEQIKLLARYGIAVEPIWLNEVLYSNLILPAGSLHRAEPTQGPDLWVIILPGGIQISYYRLDRPYAILKGNR